MDRTVQFYRRPVARVVATIALLLSVGAVPAVHPFASSAIPASPATARSAAAAGCNLGGATKHVIFLEFDNTHFMRDAARNGSRNVPSDLEQMPNLLNFLKGNGSILTNYHMPLISHTSDDITSSESGLYPGNNGVANSANSYYEYTSPGSPARQTGFTYWTSKTKDGTYNFLGANGQNAPAPWAPYTRAGCNVGGVAMSGLAFENPTDVNQTFGASSPQATDPNQFADYYGVAVHCAATDPLCSNANGGAADMLPNEPGGYNGFNALYGHKSITQALTTTGQISSTAVLTDINGNPIVDDFKNQLTNGFPGFSIAPQYSLGYVADLQEHGVPVTYAYIITPHRPLPANPYGYGFPNDTNDYGPGEAHYVAQLKQYDQAFGAFFQRLNNDGINKSNTLFVVTTDEGDHFIGETPFPATCDGVSVPCTYPPTPPATTPGITTSLGELALNFNGLLQGETGITTPVTINNDDAPDFYLNGQPAATDPAARAFEQGTAALTVTNPLSTALGISSTENLAQYQADPAEFKILHMLTADPLRTPTFVTFAQPDYYVQSGSCSGAPVSITCVTQNPGYNWNHGDVQPEITTGWLGLVGPGVQQNGLDATTFADHTDTRPTMLSLLGLADDYTDDGRVLTEDLTTIPPAVAADRNTYEALGRTFKALNAPVGPFALATLVTSTQALASGSAGNDATYTADEAQLTSLGQQRDNLTGQMQTILASAAFSSTTINDAQAQSLIAQGQSLLAQTTSTSTIILGPVFVPVTTTTTTLTPTYPLSTSLQSLAFPPGSAPATTNGITVTGYSITPTIAFQDPTSTTVGLGDQVGLTATSALTGGNVTTFSGPITITMSYSPTALPANASGPPGIYYYDTTTGAYTLLPSSQDSGTGTVTATTNHFSAYQVRVPVTVPGGTPQPTQSATATTAVSTATSTSTSATATATASAGTATTTAIPATATSTATSSPTDTATNTATNTPTNTATNTATNTPTNTATNTPVAPVPSSTSTPAPTKPPVNTPAPTATPYPTIVVVTPPSGTATATPGPGTQTCHFRLALVYARAIPRHRNHTKGRPVAIVEGLNGADSSHARPYSRTPLFFDDNHGTIIFSRKTYDALSCSGNGKGTLLNVRGTILYGQAIVRHRKVNLYNAGFQLRVIATGAGRYTLLVDIARINYHLTFTGLQGVVDTRR